MSETYYIVKEIIKANYKERYGSSIRQRGLIIAIFITFGFSVLSFYKFYNIFGKIFLIISIISLVFFYYKLYKELKVINHEPTELITNMKQSLINNKINSVELIELLQEEIDKELENIEKEQKKLFKRISVVFVSVFWIPFAFLTKYYTEQLDSVLTWESYLSLSTSLLTISLQFIGLLFAVGSPIEEFISITKKELLLTNRYLNDVKYLYNMESSE